MPSEANMALQHTIKALIRKGDTLAKMGPASGPTLSVECVQAW